MMYLHKRVMGFILCNICICLTAGTLIIYGRVTRREGEQNGRGTRERNKGGGENKNRFTLFSVMFLNFISPLFLLLYLFLFFSSHLCPSLPPFPPLTAFQTTKAIEIDSPFLLACLLACNTAALDMTEGSNARLPQKPWRFVAAISVGCR